MFDNILITSLSQQLLSNLYSDLMLCNTSSTFGILAYSTLCFFRCMHIQAYSALLRLNHAYWDIIKAYSGLFRHILHPVWLFHIHNFAIFWALAYLAPETYLTLCETLTRHIQNPTIGHYLAIFRTLGNTCIRRNLAFSQSWNIQNPSIIASRCTFRTPSHLWKLQ